MSWTSCAAPFAARPPPMSPPGKSSRRASASWRFARLGIAPQIRRGEVVFHCPQGPLALDVGPGQRGFAWFPIDTSGRVEATALVAARGALEAFLEDAMKIHPIDFEVFKNLFLSIAEEMGVTLCRTGFSPNIKERLDYSCAVYDTAGETIAQGDHMPVHLGAMPLSVNHQGQFPAITLSFNLAPGASLSQAMEAIERVKREQLWPASLKGGFQGNAQVFAASLSQQPFLILIAVVAVYMVLGILYESYVHPLTILSTLPSAGVGALLALWIAGLELDLLGLVGIVLLIGIVKKNAIMMIDFALEAERKDGLTARAAILRAAELRIRPILMTTFAALLGALPLALGTGLGSELRRPLGVAIVGGLIVSQIVTIYTTPCVYVLLDRFSRHRSRASAELASS